jgi:F-type H+-transporting ATPase subunit b
VTVAPNLSLLLIMVCFWAVFALVATQLVRPLGALLEERHRRVREGADRLAAAQRESQEALQRCERALVAASSQAQQERASVRAAGEAARRAKLEAARAAGQQRLAQLSAELEQATLQARTELRARSRELAAQLAERLLGRGVRA